MQESTQHHQSQLIHAGKAVRTQVTWALGGADSLSPGGSHTLKVAPNASGVLSAGLENAAHLCLHR